MSDSARLFTPVNKKLIICVSLKVCMICDFRNKHELYSIVGLELFLTALPLKKRGKTQG